MERHYEGNNILFLESRAHSRSLQICISFVTIYSGSNIWQDLEYMRRVTVIIVDKWLARNINSTAHVQKILFCKCPDECPLKNKEQNTWKKLAITLICKIICTKID